MINKNAAVELKKCSLLDVDNITTVNVISYLEADRINPYHDQPIPSFEEEFHRVRSSWADIFNSLNQERFPLEQFVGAYCGSDLVGFVRFGGAYWNGDDEINALNEIYVHPDYWGSGVGKMLFDNARAELKKAGCKSMHLTTTKNDPLPNRFYTKAGGWELHDEQLDACSEGTLTTYVFAL